MYAVKRNFTFFERLFIWRRMNFSEQKFILMISFVVGILTAFAGLFLKWLIHQIQYLLTYRFDATGSNALYLVYPVIGIFLTGLFVRYVVKDDISHGVTKILFAIARKQSKIKAHNTWSSVIASAITIGFGKVLVVFDGAQNSTARIFGKQFFYPFQLFAERERRNPRR